MKAIVFLADGFEECEALITVDILRRAGIETVMASIMGRLEVDSSRHIVVKADALAEEVDFDSADIVILPGGRLGRDNLNASELVKSKCLEFANSGQNDQTNSEQNAQTDAGENVQTHSVNGNRNNKLVAAICAAPTILADLGLLEGKEATCHPDMEGEMHGAVLTYKHVATSGNIITGQALGATFEFAFEIAARLVGEDAVARVKSAICY